MVPLTDLWLPILVSAVFVFIASNILWMALPFWHYRDYKKVPNRTCSSTARSRSRPGSTSSRGWTGRR